MSLQPAEVTERGVIDQFRAARLSTGQALSLLGLSQAAFVDRLAGRGVLYLDDTEEELRKQVKASARHRRPPLAGQ